MGTNGNCAVALIVTMVIFASYGDAKEFSDHGEIKIQRLLKQLNKPALKSIKSEDGNIIDCVPINNQPAFDHPLLKNHTIQYAIMGVQNGKFYGTKASINIWKPNVAFGNFSLAQTWLVSGEGNNRNTIEAGWQVYPQKYQNDNPTLFVYWTSDGYQTTGCYNLCPGFVQTNQQYSVGVPYSTVSEYDGTQLDLNLLIWKDQSTGNWWLRINEEDVMGYWPGSLFNSLGDGATKVEWGGEVFVGESHTTTDMGSGHFAEEGYKKASYVKNIMTVDESNNLSEPQGLYTIVGDSNCYNVKPGIGGASMGTHFFFGGPGQNDKCP